MGTNLDFFRHSESQNQTGEVFTISYLISGNRLVAESIAEDITLEQTIELPEDAVSVKFIRDKLFGKILYFTEVSENLFSCKISFAEEVAAGELTQFLNMLYGNISMKYGIKITDIQFPSGFLKQFKGPRFGISGLRSYLNIQGRPLIFSAIKPMGLSTPDFAELAYRLALGGLDIIKDDHGLSDQPFSRFEDRTSECCKAVARANRETGMNCIFMPNITAPFNQIISRAKFAIDAGAGGLMISPGITGFDAMRYIAETNDFGIPVFSHPALFGSLTADQSNGMTHGVLFGIINRLSGADGIIFPNFGGRFSFTEEDCRQINHFSKSEIVGIKQSFPCPGGGLKMETAGDFSKIFGNDVIYLMGGGLYRYPGDLISACRKFRELAESLALKKDG